MTEAEWVTAADPAPMLELLKGKLSNRKHSLFACACIRRIWDSLDERTQKMAEYSEELADSMLRLGLASASMEERGQILPRFEAIRSLGGTESYGERMPRLSAALTSHVLAQILQTLRDGISSTPCVQFAVTEGRDQPDAPEKAAQAALLRCVKGNPYRPVAFSPEWRTDTAIALARQMYESRDFSPIPILADALQDAGCDSDDILEHCRDTALAHVRGCWVVDLVLGKE
jgi:hypothetical protein